MAKMSRKFNNNITNLKILQFISKLLSLFDWSKSWQKMQIKSSNKVHLNRFSNEELSDPLCDSINKDLILGRLVNLKHGLLHLIKWCLNTCICTQVHIIHTLSYYLHLSKLEKSQSKYYRSCTISFIVWHGLPR